MNRLFYIIFFVVSHLIVSAQSDSQKAVTLSFYGQNFIRAGSQISVEFPIRYRFKVKEKRDIRWSKDKEVLFAPAVKVYNHKGLHLGLVIIPEFIFRTVYNSGFKIENTIGLGWHRTFIPGTTYRENSAGGFDTVKLAGQNTLYFQLQYALGYDLRKQGNLPISWHVGMGVTGRFPHNSSLVNGFNFSFGTGYFFSNKKASKS